MKQEFRNEIFYSLKTLFEKDAKETDLDELDHTFSALFDADAPIEAQIVVDVNFMPQYDALEGAEVIRFYATLAVQTKPELSDLIEERLRELNKKCIFGAFAFSPEQAEIYFMYTMPLLEQSVGLSMEEIGFVWNEIYHMLQFFLPYVLIISQNEDACTLENYMEILHGAD